MIYSDGSAIEKSAKMWELDLPPISLPTILQTTLSRKLASPKLESFVELQNTSKMFGSNWLLLQSIKGAAPSQLCLGRQVH